MLKSQNILYNSIVGFSLLILILSTSCNPYEIKYPDGGYSYPENLHSTDTANYCYPVSLIVGTKDSFDICSYGDFWGRGYNEVNLSLKPYGKDIFRLTFESAFGDDAIFIVTDDKIIVKQPKKGSPYPEYDSSKLDKLEKFYDSILKWNFPIQDTSYSGIRKKRLDSLAKLYPQLLDPAYYRYLINKSSVFKGQPFSYTTQIVKISKSKFYKILTLINASGYWKLPYRNKCNVDFTDGFGFLLEANTAVKYNAVSINCPFDKSDFVKACQEIIIAAGYEKKIKLYDGVR